MMVNILYRVSVDLTRLQEDYKIRDFCLNSVEILNNQNDIINEIDKNTEVIIRAWETVVIT